MVNANREVGAQLVLLDSDQVITGARRHVASECLDLEDAASAAGWPLHRNSLQARVDEGRPEDVVFAVDTNDGYGVGIDRRLQVSVAIQLGKVVVGSGTRREQEGSRGEESQR